MAVKKVGEIRKVEDLGNKKEQNPSICCNVLNHKTINLHRMIFFLEEEKNKNDSRFTTLF